MIEMSISIGVIWKMLVKKKYAAYRTEVVVKELFGFLSKFLCRLQLREFVMLIDLGKIDIQSCYKIPKCPPLKPGFLKINTFFHLELKY